MKVSKNSKYQTHKKSIKLTRNPNDGNNAPEGDPFAFFNIHCCKKLKGGAFGGKISEKKSHNAEKTESGTP